MNHETAVSKGKEIADSVLAANAAQHDKAGSFSKEAIDAIARAELFGIMVPAAAGGAGLGPRTLSAVIANFAEADASVAMRVERRRVGEQFRRALQARSATAPHTAPTSIHDARAKLYARPVNQGFTTSFARLSSRRPAPRPPRSVAILVHESSLFNALRRHFVPIASIRASCPRTRASRILGAKLTLDPRFRGDDNEVAAQTS